MSASRLGRCGLAVASFLVVFAGATARAADDDFEFADALSRRGYSDLAAEIFNSLINDPKATSAKKAEGQYGLALLTYGDARIMAAERNDKRREQMPVVLKKFDEADAAFARFISENGTHARNLEAKLSRGKLLQDKAEYVNVCIEKRWLPPGTAEAGWQKQVADWYDTAIQLFEAAEKKALDDKKKLQETGKDSGSEWDDACDQHALVWLYRIAALNGKGSALPKGDPAGVAALTLCVKEGADTFQWEYGESVRGLWAVHFAGLASFGLEKFADGFGHLKSAATTSNAEKDPSPALQDVSFQSFAELGRACMKAGRRDKDDWPKKALELFSAMDRNWPEWKKHPEGQRAGLVWARLLASTGASDKALTLVNEINKAADATASPTRFEASSVLSDLLLGGGHAASGGLEDMDPSQLMKIARNKWAEQDFNGAIRAFQAVLIAGDSPEELEKFGWDAWAAIGSCYGGSQRYWEAFLAFDQIEQAWRKDKLNAKLTALTDETSFSRAAALDQLFRQSKDPADKAAAQKALEDFNRDHPNSPRAGNSRTAEATAKLRAAEEVRSDPAAYKAALLEALAAHEALDPKEKTIDGVTATISQIHQKIGETAPTDVARIQKAVELAEAWLAQKRPESTESTVRNARLQGRGVCLSVALSARATLCEALRKSPDRTAAVRAATELLATIEKYSQEFLKYAANGQAQLDNWRAQGLIASEKVDDADTLVGRLLTENPGGKNNNYLAGLIATALDRRAQEQFAKGDENGGRVFMERSAKRSEWLLDNIKDKAGLPIRNPDTIRQIALRYARAANFLKAEELLTEAQKAYDDRAAADTDPERKDANVKRSRTCRIELIGLLTKQGKFDAAIPQLEKELAKDAKARDAFLKRIQTTDNISDADFRTEIGKIDANKALLDQLSEAYMKAPSKERAFAAVNLSYILTLTMPKEERHGEEWVDFLVRRAEAYLMLAEFTRVKEHYAQASGIIKNQIIIPGSMESYEQTLPGSKKRAETVLSRAEDGLRKLGPK